MGSLVGLLLVSVSVGLSNFAGSIGIGLAGIDARTRIRVGIAFGIFEAGMPLLGLVIGHALAGSLGNYGRYIGAVLLVATGAWTIYEGWGTEREVDSGGMSGRTLAVTALALSLDNLVVGFALGIYRINIVVAALVMGIVSVGMSLVGLELGARAGDRVGGYAEEIGGSVLVVVGILLAAGVLG